MFSDTANTRKEETALPCQRVLFYIWTGGRRVVSNVWVFPVLSIPQLRIWIWNYIGFAPYE